MNDDDPKMENGVNPLKSEINPPIDGGDDEDLSKINPLESENDDSDGGDEGDTAQSDTEKPSKIIFTQDNSGSLGSPSVVGGGTIDQRIGTLYQITGGSLSINNPDKHPASFHSVSKFDRSKIKEVFVKPVGYEKSFEKFIRNGSRVLIITGKENTGRFACAVYLALDIQEKEEELKDLKTCRFENTGLLDVVCGEEFLSGTICIIQNDLGISDSFAQFSNEINQIQEKLEEKKSYLIITILENDHLEGNNCVQFLSNLDQCQLIEVLENHIKYYSKKTKWINNISSNLEKSIGRLIDSANTSGISSPVYLDILVSKASNFDWDLELVSQKGESNITTIITWTWTTICPRSFSSPRPTRSRPSRSLCRTAWRSSPSPATSRRRRSASPRISCCPSSLSSMASNLRT